MQVVSFTGTEQLDDLVRTLGKAVEVTPAAVRLVVQRGAQNVKLTAQRRVAGLKHAPAYPRAITYDTSETLFGASAEIGPDKAKPQGALGNLIEFGSVHNPPIPHMLPAGDAEQPRFEAAMESLVVKSLAPGLT